MKRVVIQFLDNRTPEERIPLDSEFHPNVFVDASQVLNVRDSDGDWLYYPTINLKRWFILSE